MAFQDLNQFELLQGSFGLISVVIATLVGLRIISKAISLKRNELITVGLTWIFVSSAWWGTSFQFITFGFFNIRLNDFMYLFFANVFIPFGVICWVFSFCQILNPNLKKNFFLIMLVINIVWEIFLLVSLFTGNLYLIGTINGIFDSSFSPIHLAFIIFSIFMFLITGAIFSLKSMKVEDPEIQWKGRFLLIAWISFTISALLDSSPLLTEVTLIIVRLVLISSSIEFYLGFFLPEKISKWLIKGGK
ncbi:MAG: hypothetical protein ACFFAN_00930 [Promethearchaeota archaeon]